jgi:hypothetical protein
LTEFLRWVQTQWDRASATALVVVGAIALLLGYGGAAGTPHVAEQIPYFISGGLVGIFLLGVAGVLWLSADLRDEYRKLDELVGVLREDATAPSPLSATRPSAGAFHSVVTDGAAPAPGGVAAPQAIPPTAGARGRG